MYPRLYDIFFSSIIYVYTSTFIKIIWLKYFVLLTGIMTNLYNLHNFLLIDLKILKEPIHIMKPFVNIKKGKTQIHRLFNLFIMYPLLYYSTRFLPNNLSTLVKLMVFVGSIYNLYFYLKYNCQFM
jgi:hypothetical protein